MDVRLAAVKSLIKILEQDKTSDEVINSYAEKVTNISELINLTFGVVKLKLTLDYFIENVSSRSLKKLSHPVKNILRAAIYELEYLKVPDYAVINSYVEISKKYDQNSSRFINAVLRNFLRKKNEINFPNLKEDPVKAISIRFSHPEWLIEKWIKTYGIEETVKICEFNNKIPAVSVRINLLNSSKSKVMDLFQQNNIEFTESKISDECLILKNAGNIKNLPGYNEGYWAVQGESSSLVAKVLNPQKGERILDLCAAPGGKTTHIAALMKDSGEIVAVDISKNRIKKIEENCNRLGITCVKTIISDAATFSDTCSSMGLDKNQKFSQENNCYYDRILIDAPCSNTGVLVKRPDARWKRTPEDIKKLYEIQLKILRNASTLLKKNGFLVYSTCSIEPEENILLIQEFLKDNKDFVYVDISKFLPWKEGKEGFIQILQSQHDTDGFFIANLKKIR